MKNVNLNRMNTQPLEIKRSVRNHQVTVLTSFPAGKMAPLAAIPLLREDAVTRGGIRVQVEMQETAEILMNPVHLDVRAYVVPFLAFERFQGSRDIFDRAYQGRPMSDDPGARTVPFVEWQQIGVSEIHKRMGIHVRTNPTPGFANTAYIEAYNLIWNYRAKQRSELIEQRERLQDDLAPAFWRHSRFANIVPRFDALAMEGEVPLMMNTTALTVRGLGTRPTQVAAGEVITKNEGGTYSSTDKAVFNVVAEKQLAAVFAELADANITLSLANLEMAKKTAAFADIRKQYSGHDDDYIIDMLMNGLSIPEQHMKQPILAASGHAVFGMSKRYATDAGNLTESAVSGGAVVDLRFRVPQLHTGGVLMVVAEAAPEQLWEREADPFLTINDVEALPSFIRDTLDPQPVEVVTNGEVDVNHTQPTRTFGYRPLNAKWNIAAPRVGGKFFRPNVDTAFDEERQRIWAVEVADPVLSEDFYICSDMHQKPFLNTTADPFEATVLGVANISGNTVFGPPLIEADNGSYHAIEQEQPNDRIAGL